MQYDDVISKQREIIYNDRQKVLEGDIITIFYNLIENFIKKLECDYNSLQNNTINFNSYMTEKINDFINIQIEDEELNFTTSDEYISLLKNILEINFKKHDKELVKHYIKQNFLYVIDESWIEYIDEIEEVKKGAGLQAYKQQDPVVSFIQETGNMFNILIENLQFKIIKTILTTNYDVYFIKPEIEELEEIVDFDLLKTDINKNIKEE